jgi:hypothetical protein
MDPESAKIPESVKGEIRAKLASLGIKLTIAGDQLKQETDPQRARELRDQMAALKEEARILVERYKWAKGTFGQDPAEQAAVAAGGGSSLDDVLVFAELDAAPVEIGQAAAPAASLDDVQLVYDLVGTADAAPVRTSPVDDDVAVLDEVALTFSIEDEVSAAPAPPAARGGRLGAALGLAVEDAATRTAPWGGPLVAALLEIVAVALARGAEEDEAIAAALHAAIDERQEELQLGEIRTMFGDRVVELVAWSAFIARIDPWQQRDRGYVARMQQAPAPAIFVSMCARLVEARAELARLADRGPAALEWGGLPRDRYFWNRRMLVKAYRASGHDLVVGPLVDAWVRDVAALDDATGGGAFDGPSGPLA